MGDSCFSRKAEPLVAEERVGMEMSAEDRRRSMRWAIVFAVVSLVGITSISESVLALAALKLGAGEIYLGALSLVTFAPLVCSVFTMPLVEYRGKRRLLIRCALVSSFFVLPLLALPVLAARWPAEWCLALMMGCVLLRQGIDALGFSGWFPILQDIVPAEEIGRFFGKMRVSWQTAAFAVLIISAWFLGKDPAWWKFQVVFGVGVVALFARTVTLLPLAENPPVKTQAERSSLRSIFGGLLSKRSLRDLMIYIIVYAVGISITEPFKIKLMKDFGYSDGFILAAVSMMNLGAVLSLPYWGRLADRFGNRAIFSISHVGMIAVMVGWLAVDKSTFGGGLIIGLYLLQSVFFSGNGIAQTRYIMHVVPMTKQSYITLLSLGTVVMRGLAPLLGGCFLKLAEPLPVIGGISHYDMLFLLAAVFFWAAHKRRRRLGLQKDTPTNEVIAFVTRPVLEMFGAFVRLGRRRSGD